MEIIRILGLDSTAIDDYDINRVEEEVVRHLLHDVSLVESDSETLWPDDSEKSEDTLILGGEECWRRSGRSSWRGLRGWRG